MRVRSLSSAVLVCTASLALSTAAGVARAQGQCSFLKPIGGGGGPWVQKRISADRVVGSTNWNTDFVVDRGFASYRVNFQSLSTGRGTFPLAVFLRFTDGSNLQLLNQNPALDPQETRRFGPFPSVSGKRSSLVNVKVGSSRMPGSTGFSYRVSVEGCN
ncbi:MAG: hypothetical protein ACK46L_01535 [Synechococcaceae cyanobacterium]|jgi:hypothetical protein